MTEREASCCCGQLKLRCNGDPVRVSMCHCLSCQQRTGSTFGVQAWYPSAQLGQLGGTARRYVRRADSGGTVTFTFCPDCGTTLFWEAEKVPGQIAIAVGGFADPTFPHPSISVRERRMHPWTAAIEALPIEHID